MNCPTVEELLPAYLAGELAAGTHESMAHHVSACPRCAQALEEFQELDELLTDYTATRNLPVTLWKKLDETLTADVRSQKARATTGANMAAGRSEEHVPLLLRAHLRRWGPVVFPSGEVAQALWEFGRLDEVPSATADAIVEAIANRAYEKLRPGLPADDIVIVCFSHPIHRCGMRLASKLKEKDGKNVLVEVADDYHRPTVWCDPQLLRDQLVVVFVDVVHSGSLIERLAEVCRSASPSRVIGLVVIDQAAGHAGSTPRYALWTEDPEERISLEASSSESASPAGKLPRFDPDTGHVCTPGGFPSEVADPQRAQETIEECLRDIHSLIPDIARTGALQADTHISGAWYAWAVDVIALLDDAAAKSKLIGLLVGRLEQCISRHLEGSGRCCLVYPAERSGRAGRLAREIAKVLGWPVVGVGLKRQAHYRFLRSEQRDKLARYGRAVIVDAAIRTGKTLAPFASLLRGQRWSPCQEVLAFYVFNGLFKKGHEDLEKRLEIPIHGLFWLPLGPPIQEPVRIHWQARVKAMRAELEQGEEDQTSSGQAQAILEGCKRYLPEATYPQRAACDSPESVETNLRRALQEAQEGPRARLRRPVTETSSPSVVKYLDAKAVLSDPRVRNILHGYLGNHMPPQFLAWCASALAVAGDHSWLTKDWLLLHKDLLTHKPEWWEYLVCHAHEIKQQGNPAVAERVYRAIEEVWPPGRDQTLFPHCEPDPPWRTVQSILGETV